MKPPKGYRMLKDGERIPEKHLVWVSGDGPWMIGERVKGFSRWWENAFVPTAVPVARKEDKKK